MDLPTIYLPFPMCNPTICWVPRWTSTTSTMAPIVLRESGADRWDRWHVGDLQCFSRWSIWEWFACQSLAPDCHIMHVYIYIYIQSIYHIYYSDDNMIIMVPGIDKQTYHCIHILCLSYIRIFIAYIYYCYLWYDVYNRYSEVNRFKTKPQFLEGVSS